MKMRKAIGEKRRAIRAALSALPATFGLPHAALKEKQKRIRRFNSRLGRIASIAQTRTETNDDEITPTQHDEDSRGRHAAGRVQCRRDRNRKGLVAGIVGGMVASWTMDRFQYFPNSAFACL